MMETPSKISDLTVEIVYGSVEEIDVEIVIVGPVYDDAPTTLYADVVANSDDYNVSTLSIYFFVAFYIVFS